MSSNDTSTIGPPGLWPGLNTGFSIGYSLLNIPILALLIVNIVMTKKSPERRLSAVSVYISCGFGIALIALHYLYHIINLIVQWIPSDPAYQYFFIFGNTFVECGLCIVALYHAACVVQMAKDSDFEGKRLCNVVQVLLVIFAVLSVALGMFPTVVIGVINMVYVPTAYFYEWIWQAVFAIDITVVASVAVLFTAIAASKNVKRKAALMMVMFLCLIFVLFALGQCVVDVADILLNYFEKRLAYLQLKHFIVYVLNRGWSTLILLSYAIVFSPLINKNDGLGGMA